LLNFEIYEGKNVISGKCIQSLLLGDKINERDLIRFMM